MLEVSPATAENDASEVENDVRAAKVEAAAEADALVNEVSFVARMAYYSNSCATCQMIYICIT
jgi:hypothetical protein